MTATVVEFGPVSVRRLSPSPEQSGESEIVRAALCGLDDSVVLFGEQPADVDSLLRRTLESVVGGGCESLTLIFPTGWPCRHSERVTDVAKDISKNVVGQSRASVLAGNAGQFPNPRVTIEFSYSHVTLTEGIDITAVLARPVSPEAIAAQIVGWGVAPIYIDLPSAVDAVEEVAAVRKACFSAGSTVLDVDINTAVAQQLPNQSPPYTANGTRNGLLWWMCSGRTCVWACLLLGAATCIAVIWGNRQHLQSITTESTTDVIEARVVVTLPSGWNVDRITTGPGSKRLRATPPSLGLDVGSRTALHVTQAFVPPQQQGDFATVLEKLVKSQQPEVFTEFVTKDSTFGRPTASYRELRSDRVIRWYVFVDGSMRIGIGCESATGREVDIERPCGIAVRSAHELRPTN